VLFDCDGGADVNGALLPPGIWEVLLADERPVLAAAVASDRATITVQRRRRFIPSRQL
jgi:hypothetical protein